MANLDPLLAGIKRLANQGILLPVQSPPSIVLNAATGLSLVYNPATGQHDLTCTVSGVSTAPGGQWVTALDLDLTAQGTHTYGSDGPVSMGGYTWTKGNTANETNPTGISPSGLNFQPASGSYYCQYYSSNSRALPYLWLPLSSILSPDWDTSIRVWVDISADNIVANSYGSAAFGVDDNGSNIPSPPAVNGYICVRGYNGSAWSGASIACWAVRGGQAGSTSPADALSSMTLGTANRVCVLDIPNLGDLRARSMFASNASVWPATTLLNLSSVFSGPRAGITSSISGGAIQEVPTNMGIFMGACGAGAGAGCSVTYSRIRVDYKQG